MSILSADFQEAVCDARAAGRAIHGNATPMRVAEKSWFTKLGVLAAEHFMRNALPRCENTSDAMPRNAVPLSNS